MSLSFNSLQNGTRNNKSNKIFNKKEKPIFKHFISEREHWHREQMYQSGVTRNSATISCHLSMNLCGIVTALLVAFGVWYFCLRSIICVTCCSEFKLRIYHSTLSFNIVRIPFTVNHS